jgi:hypothetical protein
MRAPPRGHKANQRISAQIATKTEEGDACLTCLHDSFTTRDMATTINSAPQAFPHRSSKPSVPVLGVGDKIGEGDTYLVESLLPPELAEVAFEKLMKEVAWNVMHHRGPLAHILFLPQIPNRTTPPVGGEVPRLVAVQGEIDPSGK